MLNVLLGPVTVCCFVKTICIRFKATYSLIFVTAYCPCEAFLVFGQSCNIQHPCAFYSYRIVLISSGVAMVWAKSRPPQVPGNFLNYSAPPDPLAIIRGGEGWKGKQRFGNSRERRKGREGHELVGRERWIRRRERKGR